MTRVIFERKNKEKIASYDASPIFELSQRGIFEERKLSSIDMYSESFFGRKDIPDILIDLRTARGLETDSDKYKKIDLIIKFIYKHKSEIEYMIFAPHEFI